MYYYLSHLSLVSTQQTFVLMKTSFVFVFRRRLQDVLIKTNMFALALRLQKTSSRRLAKTSSRHLQDVLQRCLQDVFKTYHQVKVFLVTQFQDVFETCSECFWDVLLRRLSTGGLSWSQFWETYGQCAKFPRVIKVSQGLVFHFTTSFSGCLKRRI